MSTNRRVYIFILFAFLVVVIAGLTSELYLGDEIYHFRFAADIYRAGKRVAFDPAYGTGLPPGYFYSTEPLWNYLLAIIWKIFGRISFPVAQIYQGLYYACLLFLTYILGKRLYSQDISKFAVLIVATLPVISVFSILFYLDVPGAVFILLCLYLILEGQILAAGITMGILYLTKRNGCFLLPSFIFFIINNPLKKAAHLKRSLAAFIIPFLSIFFLDILWRNNNIDILVKCNNGTPNNLVRSATINRVSIPHGTLRSDIICFIQRIHSLKLFTIEHLNSSLTNPVDLIKYFGIPFFILLFAYFYYKRYEKKDKILWLLVSNYMFIYIIFFGINSDIRYIIPIVPFLGIIAAKPFFFLKKPFKVLLCILCILQLLTASGFLSYKRRMPQDLKQGFEWISKNTPKDALFMYPGYILLEKTGRRFLWSSFFLNEVMLLSRNLPELMKEKNDFMFWYTDQARILYSLKISAINYIVIDKTRIYDDRNGRNFNGYPEQFVRRLPGLKFTKLIFDNGRLAIWEVDLND